MDELPIEHCEICYAKLTFNIEDQTLNVSECSKCHNLACSSCIDYRNDLNKWLCRKCYKALLQVEEKSTKTKKIAEI